MTAPPREQQLYPFVRVRILAWVDRVLQMYTIPNLLPSQKYQKQSSPVGNGKRHIARDITCPSITCTTGEGVGGGEGAIQPG